MKKPLIWILGGIMLFSLLIITSLYVFGNVTKRNWISTKQYVKTEVSAMSEDELVDRLMYDDSDENTLLYYVIDEIDRRKLQSPEAAVALAKALAFPRRESINASTPLFNMGEKGRESIPYLVENLNNSRIEVRKYSIIILGNIGVDAKCTIPHIANFLRDKDPEIRGASASAINKITGNNLIEEEYVISDTLFGSIHSDDPNGIITNSVRRWWEQEGKSIEWPTKNCRIIN